jgi:hypothetical protein
MQRGCGHVSVWTSERQISNTAAQVSDGVEGEESRTQYIVAPRRSKDRLGSF